MTFPFMKNRPSMLVEAKKAKFQPHALVQVVIFVALFWLVSMQLPRLVRQGLRVAFEAADAAYPAWLSLYVLAIPIVLYVLYVKFVERRSLHSMGFARKGAASQYLTGIGVGILMLGAVLAISLATGSMSYQGVAVNGSVGLLLAWFGAYVVQGMNEEVVMRGYFLVSLSNRAPVAVAIVLSSIFFGVMHLLNPNISALPVINIVLAGGFMACYFLRTDNIWAVAGYHTMWNYCMGNVLGVSVSGMAPSTQIFSFGQTAGMDLISGGKFGLEGGLATTVALTASILLVVFLPKKK